jgi:hypothetical protein
MFNLWLRTQPNVRTIIEYPFDICNYNNPFYYYQHFHGKEVVAGYCSDASILGVRQDRDVVVGMLSVDDILEGVPPASLKARNLIDVADPHGFIASGVEVVVLHQYLMAPTIPPKFSGFVRVDYLAVPDLKLRYQAAFGQPIYEDDQVVCFSARPGQA